MNLNMHYFAFCTDAHIWPEKTNTGSNDALHIIFFQISRRIFPDQFTEKVGWKCLTVMGMTA